jgi:hypothetical protein
MTKQEVLDLIAANLATGSNITAVEHRAVEEAIVEYVGLSTVAYGKIGPIDIKGTATSYTVTGNLLSATKISEFDDINIVRVIFPSGLLIDSNFKVRIEIESNGSNVDADNNIHPVLFKKVSGSTDRVDIILQESVNGTVQSIFLHVEVVQL